jgi:hypothetical protein
MMMLGDVVAEALLLVRKAAEAPGVNTLHTVPCVWCYDDRFGFGFALFCIAAASLQQQLVCQRVLTCRLLLLLLLWWLCCRRAVQASACLPGCVSLWCEKRFLASCCTGRTCTSCNWLI